MGHELKMLLYYVPAPPFFQPLIPTFTPLLCSVLAYVFVQWHWQLE